MYYIIFFDDTNTIKLAHKSENYPTVGNLVYLFKNLEQTDIKDVEKLQMDIITEEEFESIK